MKSLKHEDFRQLDVSSTLSYSIKTIGWFALVNVIVTCTRNITRRRFIRKA